MILSPLSQRSTDRQRASRSRSAPPNTPNTESQAAAPRSSDSASASFTWLCNVLLKEEERVEPSAPGGEDEVE